MGKNKEAAEMSKKVVKKLKEEVRAGAFAWKSLQGPLGSPTSRGETVKGFGRGFQNGI